LLTGKDLTAFVKRSVEMIWWPLGFLKPRRSLITFEVYKTPKVFDHLWGFQNPEGLFLKHWFSLKLWFSQSRKAMVLFATSLLCENQ
jgi:hypothetical protein